MFFPWNPFGSVGSRYASLGRGAVAGLLLCVAVSMGEEPRGRDALISYIAVLSSRRFPTESDTWRLAEAVEELSSRFADDRLAQYWRGAWLDRERRTEEAEQALLRAVAGGVTVETAPAAVLLGVILLGQGKSDDAIERAEEALQVRPDLAEAHSLMIDASLASNRVERAKEVVGRIVETHPRLSAEVFEVWCRLLLETGDGERLTRDVNKRLAEDSACPAAQYYMARADLRRGEQESADIRQIIAALNGSARLRSTASAIEALSQRVIARLGAPTDRSTDAAWVYDQVARIELGERRQFDLDSQEWSDALRVAERLSSSDPNQQLVRDHLVATLCWQLGEHKRACELWSTIVERSPGFIPALCRLADCLESEDSPANRENVRKLRAEAFERSPGHPMVQDFVRLGVDVAADPKGVRIESIDAASPLAEVGMARGDVILEINGDKLAAIPLGKRLKRVRLFTGGAIRWRTADGTEQDGTVEDRILD